MLRYPFHEKIKVQFVLLCVLIWFCACTCGSAEKIETNSGNVTGTSDIPTLIVNNSENPVILHQAFILKSVEDLTDIPTSQKFPSSSQESVPGGDSIIPSGSIIYHFDNNITRVFDAQGIQLLAINDNESSMTATPQGFISSTRVCEVPTGSLINETGDITTVSLGEEKILTVIDRNPVSIVRDENLRGIDQQIVPTVDKGIFTGITHRSAPTANTVPAEISWAWIEDAGNWSGVSNLGTFIADWNVPPLPPSPQSNTVDFYFNCFQPVPPLTGIIQPVLEYNNVGFTNHNWTIRSWYGALNGTYYMTSPTFVNVGDKIEGTLNWESGSNRWNITTADLTTGKKQTGYVTNAGFGTTLQPLLTLEGYHISSNNDLPGTATFYNLQIKDTSQQTSNFLWSGYINTTALNMLPGLDVMGTSTWNSPTPFVTLTTINPGLSTAVYRPGVGFFIKSNNGNTWNPSTDKFLGWDNAAGDLPIAGDWNGDGYTKTGVYRPGAGFYLKMDNGNTWNPSTDRYLAWDNAANDRPVAGDWNGDGITETGVYRPGDGFYLKMDNGNTWNPSSDLHMQWDNAPNDRPIAGEWNSDGRTETGVYRPGDGFYLKKNDGNTWNPSTDFHTQWDNAAGDRPVAGDWVGSGGTHYGVYRPGSGFYLKRDFGSTWSTSTDFQTTWDNAANDWPIAGKFVL